MVMDYAVAFGENTDYKMLDVCTAEFNSEDPIKDFERYVESKRMFGEDFSECDYVALYRRNCIGEKEMMAVSFIK